MERQGSWSYWEGVSKTHLFRPLPAQCCDRGLAPSCTGSDCIWTLSSSICLFHQGATSIPTTSAGLHNLLGMSSYWRSLILLQSNLVQFNSFSLISDLKLSRLEALVAVMGVEWRMLCLSSFFLAWGWGIKEGKRKIYPLLYLYVAIDYPLWVKGNNCSLPWQSVSVVTRCCSCDRGWFSVCTKQLCIFFCSRHPARALTWEEYLGMGALANDVHSTRDNDGTFLTWHSLP